MLLASVQELADRLRIQFDAGEEEQAKTLLELASGLVQRAARQTIGEVADDELILRGSRESAIRLPERPITAIKSVRLDGELLAAESYYLDGADLVRRRGRVVGVVEEPLGGGWGHPGVELEVVYTHGWADEDIPKAIRAVVIEAAARVWVNPGAVSSEQRGSENTAYRNVGLTLTKDERRDVREAVRVGSESVSIR